MKLEWKAGKCIVDNIDRNYHYLNTPTGVEIAGSRNDADHFTVTGCNIVSGEFVSAPGFSSRSKKEQDDMDTLRAAVFDLCEQVRVAQNDAKVWRERAEALTQQMAAIRVDSGRYE